MVTNRHSVQFRDFLRCTRWREEGTARVPANDGNACKFCANSPLSEEHDWCERDLTAIITPTVTADGSFFCSYHSCCFSEGFWVFRFTLAMVLRVVGTCTDCAGYPDAPVGIALCNVQWGIRSFVQVVPTVRILKRQRALCSWPFAVPQTSRLSLLNYCNTNEAFIVAIQYWFNSIECYNFRGKVPCIHM